MQTRGKFMDVIARSEATRQSVLFAAAQNEKQHFGRIRKALRICPKDYQFAKFLCGAADCHVASLLAMTCKRLSRCYVCKRVPPGQARNRPRIRLKCYFFLPFSAGKRIATPVCALVRNDMLKTVACQRLQGRGAQGARKHAGCQRGQGTGSQ